MANQPVIHINDQSDVFGQLLNTLRTLAVPGRPRLVLIGGLGVVCHLRGSHRATEDIDFVSPTTDPSSRELLLLTSGALDVSPQRIRLDGVQVDIIEVLDPGDVSSFSAEEQLFLLAHFWALTSAESVILVTASGDAGFELLLARPAALVAMKASAITHGTRSATKQGSDLYDLIRLAQTFDRTVIEDLRTGPARLGPLVIQGVHRHLVVGATRTARLLRTGNEDMRSLTVSEIEEAGRRLAALWAVST